MVSNLVHSAIFLRYNFTTAQVVYGQLIMSQPLPAAHAYHFSWVSFGKYPRRLSYIRIHAARLIGFGAVFGPRFRSIFMYFSSQISILDIH